MTAIQFIVSIQSAQTQSQLIQCYIVGTFSTKQPDDVAIKDSFIKQLVQW